MKAKKVIQSRAVSYCNEVQLLWEEGGGNRRAFKFNKINPQIRPVPLLIFTVAAPP